MGCSGVMVLEEGGGLVGEEAGFVIFSLSDMLSPSSSKLNGSVSFSISPTSQRSSQSRGIRLE